MSRSLLSATSFRDPDEVVDLIENILDASTEYSIVATDLEGTILLWNEGALLRYGYEPADMIGKRCICSTYPRTSWPASRRR